MDVCESFLRKNHVKFLAEWLQACVEWIVEENQGRPPDNKLVNLVYEQWLMADLEEISEPCLPPNMKQKQSYSTLNGFYTLQINYFLDIGHSAYSQLLKLNGEEVVDVADDDDEGGGDLKEFFAKGTKEKTDTKRSNQPWKTKQTRMMFFELTDGAQKIEAIEYQPLHQIKIEDMHPGGKVLLSGTIKCFDGTLLLADNNIKYLGGNCENLMESKNQQKILTDILELDPRKRSTQNNNTASNIQRTATRNDNNQNDRNQSNRINTTPPHIVPTNDDHIFDDNNDFFITDNIDNDNAANEVDSIFDINNRKQTTKNKRLVNNQFRNNEAGEADLFNDSFDDFEIDPKTPVLKKEPKEEQKSFKNEDFVDNIFGRDDLIDPLNENMDGFPVAVVSLEELINYDEPIQYMFSVKGWFKTLASKLKYDNEFHLLAVITDGTKTYVQVSLGDEALSKLIGFTAKEVKDAALGIVPEVRKQFVKQAIGNAEKSLKVFSGEMHMVFDSKNEIYKIVNLESEKT